MNATHRSTWNSILVHLSLSEIIPSWWPYFPTNQKFIHIVFQGSRQVKDFDIRKEAGGAINRAVIREFKVQVSENFLEIHLFWAGKGTCCIPRLTTHGYYGPLISAIRVTPGIK